MWSSRSTNVSKTSWRRKATKRPDKTNDENAEPAPPLKCNKSMAWATRTEKNSSDESSAVMLMSTSLPPSEAAPVSVSSDFAMCQSMSGRRTLATTAHRVAAHPRNVPSQFVAGSPWYESESIARENGDTSTCNANYRYPKVHKSSVFAWSKELVLQVSSFHQK